MLRLDATPEVWVDHEESGTRYLIGALEPRDVQRLYKQARDKTGTVDNIVHNGLIVNHVVREWDKVGNAQGLLPATPENKKMLGEKFPSIANWLFGKSTDVALFVEEETAAKNA